MKRPRIAFVIPTLAPGGTERQLLYLARGLCEHFDVHVLCTNDTGPWAAQLPDQCPVGALKCRSGWDLRLQSRALNAFHRIRPDIVHSFMFGFDYAVNVAAHRAQVPVVISSRRQLATWKRPRHIRLQRRANRLVDAIVANAHAVADFAQDQESESPDLYRVVHNGIDAQRFRTAMTQESARTALQLPHDVPMLGMVANFSPVKRHSRFVKIAAILAESHLDLHFLLVGDGPLRAETQRRIDDAGILHRTHFLTGSDDIATCYKAMSVSMLCSRVEGFPNVTLESMAAGVPFVGPAVGGIVEAIDHLETGLLVNDDTVKSYCSAIASLLDNEAERTRLAANAVDSVAADFNIERMVGQYRSLYGELLEAKRSEAA